MFPSLLDAGYERCVNAWAQTLYEAIVTAAEAEKEKGTGITKWILHCPGARVSELLDVERKICSIMREKSTYLLEGRVDEAEDGVLTLRCLRFLGAEVQTLRNWVTLVWAQLQP